MKKLKSFFKKQGNKPLYCQSDLFLAEFPKSGVTWISTLITAIESTVSPFFGNAHEKKDATPGFGRLSTLIPDDSLESSLGNAESAIFGGRVIKTHSEWRPCHQRSVYLYRHPGHVMVSYWTMLRAYRDPNASIGLEEFCLHQKFGLPAWKNHINSWINKSSPSATIVFLSYEQLLENTSRCLKNILTAFGRSISQDLIDHAVQASDRKKMSEAEQFLIQNDIRYRIRFEKNYRFVGLENRNASLIQSIEPLVKQVCKEELDHLYP